MHKKYPRYAALSLAILLVIGYFLFTTNKPYVLGLDLAGGTALTYAIDTKSLPEGVDVESTVENLRDVIERRVNLFGVREPTVTTEFSRLNEEWRLSIELPGITDLDGAKALIGETPVLDFRVLSDKAKQSLKASSTYDVMMSDFVPTKLTGSYLTRSTLVFDQTTNVPIVELQFDDEGGELFATITKQEIGNQVAIFLDGYPISIPIVREEIGGGKAVISGGFTVEEAKLLVGRLNSGALPVPITLAQTNVVAPHLGQGAVDMATRAGIISFIAIAIFMVLWYRLPGAIASIALVGYVLMMLALFKVVPVTLTAAGLAGFIISIGIAIDANILVFERMKEELRQGKSLGDALTQGFDRAWTSIRDSHIAAIIISVILFAIGTSIVKGFAFTFFLGAVVSLISALFVSRMFLFTIAPKSLGKVSRFLFGSGVN